MGSIADQKGCHALLGDQIYQLLQVRIERWLPHEGDGHMSWAFCLLQPGQIRGFSSAVTGEEALLLPKDAFQEYIRLGPFFGLWHRIFYRPPAVQAELVAFQRGGHLHAAMAGNAVKMMLVALITAPQGAVKPEAGLDGSGADKMVALLGQGLPGINAVHAGSNEDAWVVYSYARYARGHSPLQVDEAHS